MERCLVNPCWMRSGTEVSMRGVRCYPLCTDPKARGCPSFPLSRWLLSTHLAGSSEHTEKSDLLKLPCRRPTSPASRRLSPGLEGVGKLQGALSPASRGSRGPHPSPCRTPSPSKLPACRPLRDHWLLTVASLYIFSSDYKTRMCPRWEIWKTHKMTKRRTAAPVTAPAKPDVSGTPSTSQVPLVAEVSSTVSSGRATECSISSAGSSTSKSLSCSQVIPFLVVLATSLIQHMVSAAVSVNSFFSFSTFLLKALLRPGARPRVALLSVRLCLRARLWVQGRGRRAGASPWRMGGGPPGH